MILVIKISLYSYKFSKCYITDEILVFRDEYCYKTLGISRSDCHEELNKENITSGKCLKFTTNALFLKPFVRECLYSDVYRWRMLRYLKKLTDSPESDCMFLKLILEPPDKEIIDYAWNERILLLVWTRVEIENAFSWLSTLGGAYSALGDYFEHCAEEAGRISIRQYKLSRMLGDDSLAARSRLYSALSHAQTGNLKLSRHIVRETAKFGRATHDKRLVRMCQGVWAKLKYLRSLEKLEDNKSGNGKIFIV